MRLLIILSLLLCSGCGTTFSSQPTVVEPLPIKIRTLKDSAIEIAIPLSVEKKKTGGYRSPIEFKVKVLLTNYDMVPIPIIPTGIIGSFRFRW